MRRSLCPTFRTVMSISIAATNSPLPASAPRFQFHRVVGTSAPSTDALPVYIPYDARFPSSKIPYDLSYLDSFEENQGNYVKESDLVSDEAIWSLYQRWGSYYEIGISKNPEKLKYFKEDAIRCFNVGGCLSPYADYSPQEWRDMFPPEMIESWCDEIMR